MCMFMYVCIYVGRYVAYMYVRMCICMYMYVCKCLEIYNCKCPFVQFGSVVGSRLGGAVVAVS